MDLWGGMWLFVLVAARGCRSVSVLMRLCEVRGSSMKLSVHGLMVDAKQTLQIGSVALRIRM
jgi:hypothetical protein